MKVCGLFLRHFDNEPMELNIMRCISQGTCAEGAIQKLFTGKMKRFTKCIDGDYESSWMEEFNGEDTRPRLPIELTDPIRCVDIKLNIKGMKTLYDSFQDYVAVETLAGESMYQAEGFGLQDARKGVTFQSFPPVLRLQLKHHEYNVQRGAVVKVRITHILKELPVGF